MVKQFVELLKERKIFRWNRKSMDTKALAILIYQAGLSSSRTSFDANTFLERC